ncbi:hypothetical protein MSAN_01203400 [Mycena sanguinolenta]|uniref:Uncharacterized protein n=1 Tax=Mycena sanguinolenta TaxID=230812 RepID=A0A8H7D4H5_9AGAR|nr:hypothetical protein MSAN_01203400 [Mycena sanguinolenta]
MQSPTSLAPNAEGWIGDNGYPNNSATSSGYSDNSVTVGGYDNTVTSGGYSDNSIVPNSYPDHSVSPHGYPNNSIAANGYPDNSAAAGEHPQGQPQGQPVDVAALMAQNAELTAMLHQLKLGYDGAVQSTVQSQMDAFRDSVESDFAAMRDAACAGQQAVAQMRAERDAARTDQQVLAQMAATIARLERENASAGKSAQTPTRVRPAPSAGKSAHTPTRDPRVRPTPSKASQSKTQSSANATPAVQTPEPAHQSQPQSPHTRRSKASKDSTPQPPPKSSRSSSKAPQPPPESSRSSSKDSAPQSSSKSSRSSSKATPSSSSSSSKDKKSEPEAKSGTRQRKLGEHQMLKDDIDPDAGSFKTSFQMHVRFLAGALTSSEAPPSADQAAIDQFNHRFDGKTVTELRRLGQSGVPIIEIHKIKLGIDVKECIRSKSKILVAFAKIEEGGLIHIKSYLAKLGITVWAVDFTQSAYSLYNMTMRMAAIETFRFLAAGTYYDFFRLNTRFVNDTGLLVRLYDHFVHHHMYEMWAAEIRTPGSNQASTQRNNAIQARTRLHASRAKYLKDPNIPEGTKLMFAAKATSDDESTPKGPRALARPERSRAADKIVRALEDLMIQDLSSSTKKGSSRAANTRSRRENLVQPFADRGPSAFREIPSQMPIQYYDPAWFNARPAQLRAKIAPKVIVAFAPGSTDFFSGEGENNMSVEGLTQKYGDVVFKDYNLKYRTANHNAKASSDDDEEFNLDDADDEGEGDSIHSQDTEDEEMDISDTGSIRDFISNDGSGSEDESSEDGDHSDEQGYASGDEQQDAEQDDFDGQAQFAAAYDIQMEIFDGPDTDEDKRH